MPMIGDGGLSEALARLVRSFADEELSLNRENPNAEARSNLVVFDFDPEDFDALLVGQALDAVGDQLNERFADVPGPVTFYAWYDEQAGQLRCSVASAEPDDLPFGGQPWPVNTPAPVLALMAAMRSPVWCLGLTSKMSLP
ncbi:hypothetical protein HS041_07710 [Planomonospora sp. ID67723]|uniref:hypothetical protein n=1 Tax=Planomonospora sp. ID67723 TaxID=2738134 RepID=UPI0018C3F168|nr:hypothetical protein [Planomonospora sp. ID67723]MBG0827647.1 hypothetical protein [Planomonospora sp. ID67723]